MFPASPPDGSAVVARRRVRGGGGVCVAERYHKLPFTLGHALNKCGIYKDNTDGLVSRTQMVKELRGAIQGHIKLVSTGRKLVKFLNMLQDIGN